MTILVQFTTAVDDLLWILGANGSWHFPCFVVWCPSASCSSLAGPDARSFSPKKRVFSDDPSFIEQM